MKTARPGAGTGAPIALRAILVLVLAMFVAACGGATSAGQASGTAAPSPAGPAGSAAVPASPGPSGAAASGAAGAAATASADPGAGSTPAASGAGASANPATPTRPPLPHLLLSINEQGAYRGIVSAASWAPAGPASRRSFGSGVPAADSLRQLRARIGSVLTIAVEGRRIGKVELYAVPIGSFAGKLSTSAPFARLRYTSGRVTGGERVPFWAPDAGEWIVYAHVTFTDGAGDGTWLWRVLVR